jgi:hypothetical protein
VKREVLVLYSGQSRVVLIFGGTALVQLDGKKNRPEEEDTVQVQYAKEGRHKGDINDCGRHPKFPYKIDDGTRM